LQAGFSPLVAQTCGDMYEVPHSTSVSSTPPFAGRGYRLMQTGFWSLFALTVTVTLLSGPPSIAFKDDAPATAEALRRAFAALQPVMWIQNLAMILCGILATHQLHLLSLRHRWDLRPLRRLAPVVLLSCVGLAAGISLLINALRWFLAARGFGSAVAGRGLVIELVSTGAVALFLLGMWAALYYACQAFTRLHQIEVASLRHAAAIKEARLQTIATQLNPHFLFNSLNTLRALIDENPKHARDAVTQLSLVLRASLTSSDRKLIPLRDELSAVNALLDLELARYGDRLEVERHVGVGCEKALVPPLLLVTLVENAVKHGVAARLGPGFLRYEASLGQGGLCLHVRNSGALIENWQGKGGIGLAHTRERLALLFGSAATMTLSQTADGVEASVCMPQPQPA
jgi:two-component system LytT family sensor kinase